MKIWKEVADQKLQVKQSYGKVKLQEYYSQELYDQQKKQNWKTKYLYYKKKFNNYWISNKKKSKPKEVYGFFPIGKKLILWH